MKDFDEKAIKDRIEAVARKQSELSPEVAKQVAFHMTDWLRDLKAFWSFCEQPSQRSDEDLNKMLIEFLVHVPNHLAAAGKLLTGIAVKDTFEVGALTDDD